MNYSTLAGNRSNLICCNVKHFFVKAFATLFFLVFIIQFNANAQGSPSCNLSGPLKGTVRGAAITVNVQVANSTATPNLKYTLQNNTSGASISAKGAVTYNAATNTATQQVTILPGTTAGGFNLQLVVTTPSGTCQCSKSVSVAN